MPDPEEQFQMIRDEERAERDEGVAEDLTQDGRLAAAAAAVSTAFTGRDVLASDGTGTPTSRTLGRTAAAPSAARSRSMLCGPRRFAGARG
jgi:hypothetical protein